MSSFRFYSRPCRSDSHVPMPQYCLDSRGVLLSLLFSFLPPSTRSFQTIPPPSLSIVPFRTPMFRIPVPKSPLKYTICCFPPDTTKTKLVSCSRWAMAKIVNVPLCNSNILLSINKQGPAPDNSSSTSRWSMPLQLWLPNPKPQKRVHFAPLVSSQNVR